MLLTYSLQINETDFLFSVILSSDSLCFPKTPPRISTNSKHFFNLLFFLSVFLCPNAFEWVFRKHFILKLYSLSWHHHRLKLEGGLASSGVDLMFGSTPFPFSRKAKQIHPHIYAKTSRSNLERLFLTSSYC